MVSKLAFSPLRLGPLTLKNRFIKAATFEGVMARGTVSDALIDFHTEVARGGAAMTTVAYCAISPGGRVHRDTVVLDRDRVPQLRRLTEAVHAAGALVCAQIGHAGLVANTLSNRTPTLAPSTRVSAPAMGLVRAATAEQLDAVVDGFGTAAQNAVDAGFDALEIHMGHGYLLSSFFSPNLNRRTDRFGGDTVRRAELARRVAERVRATVGDSVAVTAKFNMDDGVRGGFWLDDSIPTARLLESDGHLDALQLTGGSSLLNPMYYFRGDVPMDEFIASQPRPVGVGLRVMGRRLFRTYPFEEAFFSALARQFRAAMSMPLILLGGINRLDTVEGALAEGFEFVAMARALLRDPFLVNRFREDSATEGLCIHCMKCMPTVYSGTHCVVRERIEAAPVA
ncbi:NADH:flavin oxidoreductase [Mycobacterium intracellulare]|jgi:2,4-dienoyl-CoA reductase-like NADH-dependent reductase (Old Yellow Enzyme family)|uniref:NADH:flavin oxidoreductase n=1 Tax=Mycobacterium intracellulare TaxID=1767 RepID=UPI0001B45724|nr:NADH:flavin oxidoreductase [Mycobacterium intracellulare]AFC46419.1 putative oxidoreductase [Mycobacterium intracellulare MOTT-02]ASW93321.1 NADH:flavin oxidoreductase [Mycobacterium intracellulare]MCA2233868.1 NADH:flavin oxidoreductase [Mycobacterium intracellulare]MCA2246604.1 NADH:flavin oxidoreductase [Mycobacterium intracellulare]MDM3896312.1 NADH:flavin oxidoreductase [Mycobacterium intracellulare]